MTRTVAAILVLGAVLASVPWLGLPQFYESILYLVCHWAVLALSWNILSGYSGYFSFGHGAFFGIGMYTTAALAAKAGWPFLATLPFAALLPALLGVGLGFVVFRVKGVRGEVFALLTLAVTFVVATVILNSPIDGGPGVYLNAVETPKLGPSPASSLYLMILMAAIATVLIAYKVQVSKLGIGLFAKPTNILLVVPLLVSAALRRQWMRGIKIGVVFAAVAAALFALNIAVTGDWNYQGGERKTFYGEFPGDVRTRDGVPEKVTFGCEGGGAGGSALDQQLGEMMGDAPMCEKCGHITVRNGACYRCLNCGNSMGCS